MLDKIADLSLILVGAMLISLGIMLIALVFD